MNLIAGSDPESSKKCYQCPMPTAQPFTYSLNCNEIYKQTGTYGSWHDSDFAKSLTDPSKIIIVEECNITCSDSTACDKDNYSNPYLSFTAGGAYDAPYHGKQIPFLFVDGHAKPYEKFDTSAMTYYTTIMAAWFE